MGTDPTNPTVALAESRDRESVLAARKVRSQGECLALTRYRGIRPTQEQLLGTPATVPVRNHRKPVDVRTPIKYHH